MSPRVLSTSRRADDDIAAAVNFYLEEARPDTATRFVDELERVFAKIAEYPAIGSGRVATDAGIPGARSVTLRRFPYAAFSLESGEGLRVIRVLHTRQDLFAELRLDE